MRKIRIFQVLLIALFFANHIHSQQLVLVVENSKNKKFHVIKPGDKVKLDIKNKKGKLKEEKVVLIASIDQENLYIEPVQKKYPNQKIEINEIKSIYIKTPGTRTTGCLLLIVGIFSKSLPSKTDGVYKKIRFDEGKWEKRVLELKDLKFD